MIEPLGYETPNIGAIMVHIVALAKSLEEYAPIENANMGNTGNAYNIYVRVRGTEGWTFAVGAKSAVQAQAWSNYIRRQRGYMDTKMVPLKGNML